MARQSQWLDLLRWRAGAATLFVLVERNGPRSTRIEISN
jgi:hypothetical protein